MYDPFGTAFECMQLTCVDIKILHKSNLSK